MIRCSHCGKLAPVGTLTCEQCGMPLASSQEGVPGSGPGKQEELPAWLESLRAHDRPVAGGQGNRPPFAPEDLVDENAMPSWMSQDRPKAFENGFSDVLPVVSAGTGPQKPVTPAGGFQAGSLIDERSLPTWMRENQQARPGQPSVGQNVSAGSLVDQQALPPWIKNLGQAAPSPAPSTQQYGLPASAPAMGQYDLPMQTPVTPPDVPQTPQAREQSRSPSNPLPAVPPAAGFSAHELLDMQSMPAWMTNAQGPGQSTGALPPTRPTPMGQGFSAGELVDGRSVPAWMKSEQGQTQSDPRSAMGVPVDGSGQMTGTGTGQGFTSGERNMGMPAAGFGVQGNSLPGAPQGAGMAAGSLIDPNALPAWMRESQQNPPQGVPSAQQAGVGMAAGSLIDPNALPAWMREGQPGATSGNTGASGRVGQPPARPVPSRPRNEVPQAGQHEVAANLFSSMLGVAASAPVLPGQEQNPAAYPGNWQGQPVPPYQQGQPSLPGWQQPGMNQYPQGVQPPAWQQSGSMQTASQASNANASASPGQPGGVGAGNMPSQAYQPAQPAWTGMTPLDQGALATGSGSGTPRPAETKKKGFFETIRDFFSR